jgi:hypothetical protein
MTVSRRTENPSPSLVAANAVHKIDQASEETAESASCSSGREEEGNTKVDLVSAVPLSQEERDSRLE